MKRALASVALLWSAAAFAGWYGVDVPGRPNDAKIVSVDGGVVVVATNDGLFHVRDGGVVQQLQRGTDVAWGTLDGGCLTGYTRGGLRVACDGSATQLRITSVVVHEVAELGAVRYMLVNEAGSNKLALDDRAGSFVLLAPSPTIGSPALTSTAALTAYERGGVTHALVSRGPQRNVLVAVDAGYDYLFDAGFSAFGDIDTFTEGLSETLLIATTADAGGDAIALRTITVDAPVTRASTPAEVTNVASVTFDPQTNATNSFGDGHGMACAQTAAGSTLLQPIPDPLNPARVWLPNSAQPSLAALGKLTRVRCERGRLCVVMTDFDAGTNVFIYENRSAPQFSSAGSGTLAAGQTSAIVFTAMDPDGDPVVYDAGLAALQDAGVARVLDAGVVELTAGAVCGAQKDLTVPFGASDGVHDSSQTFLLTITPGNPDPPTLSTALVEVQAGTDAGRVDVTRAAGGVCPATAVVWTQVDGGAAVFQVSASGDSRIFTPPTHLCSATPEEVAFSVTATNGQGTSTSQTVIARLLPWGPPDKPFASDLTISIDAGSSVVLSRDGGHFCGALADPSTVTSWVLPVVDGGVRANTGGPVVGLTTPLTVTGNELTLSTAECVSASFDIPVSNEIAGLRSPTPDSIIHVNVTPNLAVSNVSLGPLTGFEHDGGILVNASTDFVCAGAIGLSANVTLSRDGGFVGSKRLEFTPTTGTTFFPLPDCAGGTFEIVASLVGSDGGVGNVSAPAFVTIAPGVVPAPTVITEETDVVCASGGTASLAIVARPECTGLSYSWVPLPGLETTISHDGGETATLRTVSTALGEILGQTVSVQVTPTSGPQRFPTEVHEVTFEHRPFVDVRHETDAPIAADTELFGITVTLTNNETCEVDGVDYVETLTDTRVVPQSVRVNGDPIDSERIVIGSRTMAITGLSLPPGEPVRIYYSARPVLFGSPKPTGKAVLRLGQTTEYDISETAGFAREPGTNPPGCGCEAGSGGLFALLALLGLWRRRRSER